MAVRGIRGATTVDANTVESILQATRELLAAIVSANNVRPEDVASAIFTATPDLNAAFPARAAREFGWQHVPLLDAVEIAAAGGLPRTVRVLVHWNTDRPIYDVRHVYLRDAVRLRPDLIADPLPAAPEASEDAAPSNGKWRGETIETVAFQGEAGAYSQEAIFQHFGAQAAPFPARPFKDVFRAGRRARPPRSAPGENSAGRLHQPGLDLLARSRPEGRRRGQVAGAPPPPRSPAPGRPTSGSSARTTRLWPSASAIVHAGWEAHVAYDTAGVARTGRRRSLALRAIAGALAAQTYGLEVLDSASRTHPTTRHALLPPRPGRSRRRPGATRPRRSSPPCTRRALHHVLGEPGDGNINLTGAWKAARRRNRPWHYVFYVDMEGHWQDATINPGAARFAYPTGAPEAAGQLPRQTNRRIHR